MSTSNPLDPQSGQPKHDSDAAAEVIRNKIQNLYKKDPPRGLEAHEPSAAAEKKEVEHLQHRTKHQQYMYDLSHSGKSLAEIQTAWHAYYTSLSDHEKHQVWQEFYAEHERAKQPAHTTVKKTAAKKEGLQTVTNLKQQLLGRVNSRSKAKLQAKHHLQSVLFGLGAGSFLVLILLFSFFNERVIAPFIAPSKTVTNTPIISDASSAVGNEPQVIIPKINVQIPVVYGLDTIEESQIENSLEDGVVHYATTASPGEKGNTVIFGHSSNNILNKGKYKFAFVLLNRLQIGDTFTLTKDGKRYVYQIYERKVVKPTDVSVLNTNDKVATATLITCDPPGTSINRLVVVGEQISPSPAGNTASTAVKSDSTPTVVPSASPSLWHRLTSWLTS